MLALVDPIATSIGNVLPKPPVLGDEVSISIRISDESGKLMIYADTYGFNFPSDTQTTRGPESNTVGVLMKEDKHHKDLNALCAIRTHKVEGEVVSVGRSEPCVFTVRWMCSAESACARV